MKIQNVNQTLWRLVGARRIAWYLFMLGKILGDYPGGILGGFPRGWVDLWVCVCRFQDLSRLPGDPRRPPGDAQENPRRPYETPGDPRRPLQGSQNYMVQNEPELHGFRKVVVVGSRRFSIRSFLEKIL